MPCLSATPSGTHTPPLRAGLPCIGLLSGGISEGSCRQRVASPIFSDPQDLLDHLDSTRIAALASAR